MTQEQIDAALLVQSDMPTGWTQNAPGADEPEATEEAEQDLTYAPAECKDVVEGLSSGEESEADADASGEVSFSTENYQFIEEEIASGVGQMNVAKLNALTDALSACPSYTTTDAEGTISQYTISALDMPNYGDRTLAVRLAAGSDPNAALNLTLTIDIVIVSSGNVAVSLVVGGFQPVDPAVTQQVASTAMAKVNSAG